MRIAECGLRNRTERGTRNADRGMERNAERQTQNATINMKIIKLLSVAADDVFSNLRLNETFSYFGIVDCAVRREPVT